MEQLTEFVVNHWILVTAFCAVAGLLLANLMGSAGGVAPQTAVAMINRERAVVVDVRPAEQFAKAHILDAVNIPTAEIEKAGERLRKHHGQPLLVCCDTGSHSATAARRMRAAGLEQVQVLSGGLAAWRQENLPVVSA